MNKLTFINSVTEEQETEVNGGLKDVNELLKNYSSKTGIIQGRGIVCIIKVLRRALFQRVVCGKHCGLPGLPGSMDGCMAKEEIVFSHTWD